MKKKKKFCNWIVLKFPNLNKKKLRTIRILLESILLCFVDMKVHIFGYNWIIIQTYNGIEYILLIFDL